MYVYGTLFDSVYFFHVNFIINFHIERSRKNTSIIFFCIHVDIYVIKSLNIEKFFLVIYMKLITIFNFRRIIERMKKILYGIPIKLITFYLHAIKI